MKVMKCIDIILDITQSMNRALLKQIYPRARMLRTLVIAQLRPDTLRDGYIQISRGDGRHLSRPERVLGTWKGRPSVRLCPSISLSLLITFNWAQSRVKAHRLTTLAQSPLLILQSSCYCYLFRVSILHLIEIRISSIHRRRSPRTSL